MEPDTISWLMLAAPVIVGVVIAALNVWSNTRVMAAQNKSHEKSMNELRIEMKEGNQSTTATLSNFGERMGSIHEEMVRLQERIGTSDSGLMRDVHDVTKRVRDLEVRGA